MLLNDTSNNIVSTKENVAYTDGIESTMFLASNDFTDDVHEFDGLFQLLGYTFR